MNTENQSIENTLLASEEASEGVASRLPLYYRFLKNWEEIGYKTVTSSDIGLDVNLNPDQIIQDLESIGIISSPRIGYVLCNLIYELELNFGWNKVNDGILVGAGSIGSALMGYPKFEQCGMKIVAAFDLDESKLGIPIHGKDVYPLEIIVDFIKRRHIDIGVITVPGSEAQGVADLLVQGGIRAIWNFSPVHLDVPEEIIVQNEDLYCSLASLSKKLNSSEVKI